MNIVVKPYKGGTRLRGKGSRHWQKRFNIFCYEGSKYEENYNQINWRENAKAKVSEGK